MPSLPTVRCTGCGACVQCCPKKALSLSENCEGFLYPEVDDGLCVNCGLCEKSCPVNSTGTGRENFSERKAFACIANGERIREESSSGGMFTVLAEKIIKDGGIVFGAEFDEDFSVRLSWTDRAGELEKFRGSKYVQARTESSFSECKKFLEDGRKVLFAGTPCQIAGLKGFLKKEYENLYAVDFICHGVPSPALWQKYIKYREKKSASRTVKTAFRRKNDGWKLYSLSFTFANDSEYRRPLTKDRYLQIFLKDNALRESCYDCPFRGDRHKSDLTVADFWGIEQICQDFFDDRGTSLVIVQSGKGRRLLDACRAGFRSEQVDFRAAVKCNPAYFESPARNRKRTQFYRDFDRHGIDRLYRRFGRDSFAVRAAKPAKRVVLKAARCVFGERFVRKMKNVIQGGRLKG